MKEEAEFLMFAGEIVAILVLIRRIKQKILLISSEDEITLLDIRDV